MITHPVIRMLVELIASGDDPHPEGTAGLILRYDDGDRDPQFMSEVRDAIEEWYELELVADHWRFLNSL